MTLDEARKIAVIIGTADNGCPTCVGNLMGQVAATFREFIWTCEGKRVQPAEWMVDEEVRAWNEECGLDMMANAIPCSAEPVAD